MRATYDRFGKEGLTGGRVAEEDANERMRAGVRDAPAGFGAPQAGSFGGAGFGMNQRQARSPFQLRDAYALFREIFGHELGEDPFAASAFGAPHLSLNPLSALSSWRCLTLSNCAATLTRNLFS